VLASSLSLAFFVLVTFVVLLEEMELPKSLHLPHARVTQFFFFLYNQHLSMKAESIVDSRCVTRECDFLIKPFSFFPSRNALVRAL
jgi:uncharacterized membrane protein